MDLEYRYLLPENFAPGSRVWVYQSSRLFMLSEALELEEVLEQFSGSWRSHGAEVNGWAQLFFGQFLVIMADESSTTVSGCSTDASVRFVKETGAKYGVDFFNRTNMAFVVKDKIEQLPLNQLEYAWQNGFIQRDTLYFNNLVQTKEELEKKWIIPVKDSWLAARLAPFAH
jgi:hypothetical protein